MECVACFMRFILRKKIKCFLSIVCGSLFVSIISTDLKKVSFSTTTDNSSTISGREFESQNEPIQDIVYVKIPKTGSSTIRGIFHRFCDNHKLKCAPFAPGSESPGYTADQIRQLAQMEQTGKSEPPVAIFGPHFFYNHSLMTHFRPNAVRVASFRHPVARMRSDFHYLKKFWAKFQQFTNFSHFVNTCHALYTSSNNYADPAAATDSTFSECYYMHNVYVKYLSGVENISSSEMQQHYETALRNLKEDNFTVIVTESMDTGLIVLAERLRWNLHDILYLPMKQYGFGNGGSGEEEKINQMEAFDMQLYEAAQQMFAHQVAELYNDSTRLSSQLRSFKLLQSNLEQTCSYRSKSSMERWRAAMQCHLYMMDEVEYLRKEKCRCEKRNTHNWVFMFKQAPVSIAGRENYRVHCLLKRQAHIYGNRLVAVIGRQT